MEEGILDTVGDEPSTNTQVVVRILGVPHFTAWRVLKVEMLHPYNVQRVQELTATNYPRRVYFVRWILQQSAMCPDFAATVIFTNECTSTRDGEFNTHNQH